MVRAHQAILVEPGSTAVWHTRDQRCTARHSPYHAYHTPYDTSFQRPAPYAHTVMMEVQQPNTAALSVTHLRVLSHTPMSTGMKQQLVSMLEMRKSCRML